MAYLLPATADTTPLSEWDSPTLATVITLMNQPSDNYIAETLVKDLGAEFGQVGSTTAGARVVMDTVKQFGIAPHVQDGSGLSSGAARRRPAKRRHSGSSISSPPRISGRVLPITTTPNSCSIQTPPSRVVTHLSNGLVEACAT